jgi:hypothetical protein
MKEQTIITNFNQLNNKYNKLAELVQQNIRQIYMIQAATSMTIDALTNLLVEKGLMSQDDIKVYIEKEQAKRSNKTIENKEKELEKQPVFNTDASIPTPEDNL